MTPKDLAGFLLVSTSLAAALPVPNEWEDQIDVTLRVRGQVVTLNLTRNHHIAKVPLYVGSDDGISVVPDDGEVSEDCHAYIDETNNAAFVVTQGRDGRKQYHGIFSHEEHSYVIEPRDSPSPSRRRKRNANVEILSADLDNSMLYEVDASRLDFENDERYSEEENDTQDLARDPASYTRGYRSLGVRILLVVDYKIYQRWRELTRSYREAVFGLRNYFTHVANGIDLRYRSIRESRFGIYVKLAGIYIAESPSASYWTMRSGIREADTYSQGYYALEEFEGWVSNPSTRKRLPLFDQASLYTGQTLFRHRSDGSRRTFSGLAAYNSICRFKAPYGSASISHDGGIYASIQTGAHELGHNLGARHDSSNTNGCDSSDQFIMAVSPGRLNEDNFQNPFAFSRCSIYYFEQFLLYNLPDSENCLLDRTDHESSAEVQHHLRHLPGSRFDVDSQCRLLYGPSSFYCAGGHADESLCHRMYCFHPQEEECVGHTEQRAFDGTTCGDRKWCEDGECVYDRLAPSAKDSCIYGDYRWKVYFTDMTCQALIEKEPHRCYDQRYYDRCCQSCAQLRKQNRKGCDFGDKKPSYCATIDKHDCYDEYATDNCCGTCAQLYTGVRGCEYGDKAGWCNRITDAGEKWQCYRSDEICCESCPKIKADISAWRPRSLACRFDQRGECATNDDTELARTLTSLPTARDYNDCARSCPYGDRATWCRSYVREASYCERSSTAKACCATCQKFQEGAVEEEGNEKCKDNAGWCTDLFPGHCYRTSTRKTCCKRCSQMETGRSNCTYGDRYSWCERKYCDTDGADCCGTCR